MALRCVVMMEKCRAPSIIRKPMRRQLRSTTASDTLQPSSLALATPAWIILRLAVSVRRCVVTMPDMTLRPKMTAVLSRQPTRRRHEQFVDGHRLGDDTLRERVADLLLDNLAVRLNAVRQRI